MLQLLLSLRQVIENFNHPFVINKKLIFTYHKLNLNNSYLSVILFVSTEYPNTINVYIELS